MRRITFKIVGTRRRRYVFDCRSCGRRATLCGRERCYTFNCRHCSRTGVCQGCQQPLPGYAT